MSSRTYGVEGHFFKNARAIYENLASENRVFPDAFLINDDADLKYAFEGVPVEGWLTLEPHGKVIYWGSPLWVESAKRFFSDLVEIREREKFPEYASKKVIAIDARNPSTFRDLLVKTIEKPILSTHRGLRKIRSIKREDEIEKILRACEIAVEAFKKFLEKDFREGITEREASQKLKIRLFESGAEQLAFEPIVAFGENTAYPHHFPADREYKRGEPAMFDWGAVYRGYHSDITRTINAEKLPWYEVYMKAFRTALKEAKTGKSASELHKNVEQSLGELAQYFPHGTGHGVGLEIHEIPNLSEKSTDVLQENQVFTIEPGIYKNYGLRIENTYLLTKNGLNRLCQLPEEI